MKLATLQKCIIAVVLVLVVIGGVWTSTPSVWAQTGTRHITTNDSGITRQGNLSTSPARSDLDKRVLENMSGLSSFILHLPLVVSSMGFGFATITVGTNAEYPPFEFVDAYGKIVGFDIDVMSAIAEASGFEFNLVNTRWDGLLQRLADGEFDAVVSGLAITEYRRQIVDFSDPYFNDGLVIAVTKDSDIQNAEGLVGRRIGVQVYTTGETWCHEHSRGVCVGFDRLDLPFQALAIGDIDAVVANLSTSSPFVRASEGEIKIVGDLLTDGFFGIATNKDHPEVLAAINYGLNVIRESGEYDAIFRKWFDTAGANEFVLASEANQTRQ